MNGSHRRKPVRLIEGLVLDQRTPPLLAPLMKLLGRLELPDANHADVEPKVLASARELVVRHALRIVGDRLHAAGDVLTQPDAVRTYLRLLLADAQCELFMALYVDAQHRLIDTDELFRGTLAQTSVYPREVVKAALAHNAAAVIFAHNHPSGLAEPSRADELLTSTLKQALALVDIRVLDHFVVGGDSVVSFAERGLL